MHAVVQVVALRQGFLGNLAPAWTGSGTIVDSSGIILTNCHVANPRAIGMPPPSADRLAIAVTQQSDEPLRNKGQRARRMVWSLPLGATVTWPSRAPCV